jgi:hypothetical protein
MEKWAVWRFPHMVLVKGRRYLRWRINVLVVAVECLEGEVRDIVGRWAEHVIFTLHVARLGCWIALSGSVGLVI